MFSLNLLNSVTKLFVVTKNGFEPATSRVWNQVVEFLLLAINVLCSVHFPMFINKMKRVSQNYSIVVSEVMPTNQEFDLNTTCEYTK